MSGKMIAGLIKPYTNNMGFVASYWQIKSFTVNMDNPISPVFSCVIKLYKDHEAANTHWNDFIKAMYISTEKEDDAGFVRNNIDLFNQYFGTSTTNLGAGGSIGNMNNAYRFVAETVPFFQGCQFVEIDINSLI